MRVDREKDILYSTLTLIGLIITIYIISQFASLQSVQTSKRMNCPYNIEGNASANVVIKYVDSPYCFWCFLQEPILKKMVETKGDSFRLEKYDIRYCGEIVNKYGFSGTPSFVFSLDSGMKEFISFGYIDEERFYNLICELTGDCHDS